MILINCVNYFCIRKTTNQKFSIGLKPHPYIHQVRLHLVFLVGSFNKFSTNGCSHFFLVQLVWLCSFLFIMTWPTRLILSMYSEIGNGLANNCLNGVFFALFTLEKVLAWRQNTGTSFSVLRAIFHKKSNNWSMSNVFVTFLNSA